MGAADGYVIGATKIVDHGPADSCWNLVLVAEGYQAAEMNKFTDDADHFVSRMHATAPFDLLWDSINVWRIDVASNKSGADTAAGDVATYFDANLTVDASGYALLVVDDVSAQTVADTHVGDYQGLLVIVNLQDYGGSGEGVAAVCSTAEASGFDGADIGLHELAHQAFDLEDEYSNAKTKDEAGEYSSWAGGGVDIPNVSDESAAADVPWKDLLTAGVPVPANKHTDPTGACTLEDEAISPLPPGTVSAFEGAFRRHCGLFRAEFNCKMRDVTQPFCAVCRQRIAATIESSALSETEETPPAEEPSVDPGPDDHEECGCRDLLDCLTKPPVISRTLIQNLENLGLDWRELRRCITGPRREPRGPF